MRIVWISLLALIPLSGCVALHANLPEEMVRHMARKDGMDLSAICSHEGRSYSEGGIICVVERRLTCDASGRWVQDEAC